MPVWRRQWCRSWCRRWGCCGRARSGHRRRAACSAGGTGVDVWIGGGISGLQGLLHGVAPVPPDGEVRLPLPVARQRIADALLVIANSNAQCGCGVRLIQAHHQMQQYRSARRGRQLCNRRKWAAVGNDSLSHCRDRQQQPPVLQRPLRNRPLLGFRRKHLRGYRQCPLRGRYVPRLHMRQKACTPFHAAQKRGNRRGLWGGGGLRGHSRPVAVPHLSLPQGIWMA